MQPAVRASRLELEPAIGALFPCNVVVRTTNEGRTRIDVMDPAAVLGLVDKPEVEPIAREVRDDLLHVRKR